MTMFSTRGIVKSRCWPFHKRQGEAVSANTVALHHHQCWGHSLESGVVSWFWCSGGAGHMKVCMFMWLWVFHFSYNCTVHAAAAVIAIIVPAWQVGRGHERVTLVGTAVLKEDVHTLLTVSLPRVRQCRIAVSIPCHDVHAVLERNRRRESAREHVFIPEN